MPRLWAGKKVDYLLNELRKSGKEDKELVDEVTFLAKKYGIVTPYTAYLMAEDIVHNSPGVGGGGGPMPLLTKLREGALRAKRWRPPRPPSGPSWFATARTRPSPGRMPARGSPEACTIRPTPCWNARAAKARRSSKCAYVASRTFYNANNTWYEGTYEPAKHDKQVQRVKLRSKEYFNLIDKDSRVAQYLALGNVVVNLKGQWYQFEE